MQICFIHSFSALDLLFLSIMFHEGISALDLNSLYQAAVRFQDSATQVL